MKRNLTNLLIVSACIFTFGNAAVAQAKASPAGPQDDNQWITFSPPSKSFTVQLPLTPLERTESSSSIAFSIFRGTTALSAFTLPSLTGGKKNRLVIWDVQVSPCERTNANFDKELLGLLLLLAGDEHKLITDDKGTLNGYETRNIAYENGSERAGRLFAINAGDRIVLLGYIRTEGDLKEEDRIFRSFKLLPIGRR